MISQATEDHERYAHTSDADLADWAKNENATIRILAKQLIRSRDRSEGSLYVQHITGYGPHGLYDHKAKLMESYGFVRLRSRMGYDATYWEIWWLPGKWMAAGEAKDLPIDKIRDLVFRTVCPGETNWSGEHWGLSID